MAVRTRHVAVEPAVRRRLEHAGQRLAPQRGHVETLRGHVETLRGHIGPQRGRIETPRSHFETPRSRFQPSKNPARRLSELRDGLERRLLHISAILFFVGSVGWCWLVFSEFRTPILVSPAEATYSAAGVGKADLEISKSDPFSSSTYARANDPHAMGSLGALFSAVWQRSLGSASLGSASLGSASLGSASLGSASLGSASLGSASLGSASLGGESPCKHRRPRMEPLANACHRTRPRPSAGKAGSGFCKAGPTKTGPSKAGPSSAAGKAGSGPSSASSAGPSPTSR